MDNASIHKKEVKERSDVKYFLAYSPFFNPIEYVFSVIKVHVKKVLRQWRQSGKVTNKKKFSGHEI